MGLFFKAYQIVRLSAELFSPKNNKKGGVSSTAKSAEFILKEGVRPVLVVEPYGPSFPKVIEKLSEDSSFQIAECESYMDVVSIARRVDGCVVLCHAAEQEHLVKHITLLKLLTKEIQKKQIRVIITTKFIEGLVDSKLELYGVSEVVHEPITAKSLQFKIERHLKALSQPYSFAKPNQPQSGHPYHSPQSAQVIHSEVGHETAAAELATETPPITETIHLAQALPLESDFWLLSGGGAKMSRDRWAVRLMGPGPSIGHWVKAEFKGNLPIVEAEGFWEWTPNDADADPFMKELGAWIFKGQRPDYQDGLWLFAGKNPELSFYYESEKYGSKLTINDEGELVVARDSPFALRYLPLIKQSHKNLLMVGTAEPEPEKIQTKTSEDEKNTKSKSKPGSKHEQIFAHSAPPFKLTAPLNLRSDCWLLQRRRPHWIADRWLIKMTGPGPSAGRWVQTEIDEPAPKGFDEAFWQWVPSKNAVSTENDPFVSEAGAWIYRGYQPKFQEDHWIFVGKSPKLGFYQIGISKGNKVTVEDTGSLLIARDSDSAKQRLREIEKSIELTMMPEKPLIRAEIVEEAVPIPAKSESESESESESQSVSQPIVAEPAVDQSVAVPESVIAPEPVVAVPPVVASTPETVTDTDSASVSASQIHLVEPMSTPSPEIVAAPEPPGPSLSPLALALLMSELLAKRGLDLTKMTQRYCAYVGASCGGLKTELWLAGDPWTCAGTHNGQEGVYADAAKLAEEALAASVPAQVKKINHETFLVAPIYRSLHVHDRVVGALVLTGKGVELVSPEYASAAAQMVCGLFQALLREAPGIPADRAAS